MGGAGWVDAPPYGCRRRRAGRQRRSAKPRRGAGGPHPPCEAARRVGPYGEVRGWHTIGCVRRRSAGSLPVTVVTGGPPPVCRPRHATHSRCFTGPALPRRTASPPRNSGWLPPLSSPLRNIAAAGLLGLASICAAFHRALRSVVPPARRCHGSTGHAPRHRGWASALRIQRTRHLWWVALKTRRAAARKPLSSQADDQIDAPQAAVGR